MKPSPAQDKSPGHGGQADHAARTVRALAASLRLQSLVAVGLTLAVLPAGPVAAYSSMCGSLAVYVPGLAFTLLVARRIGGDSTAFVRTAALAEFGKLALTGVLCAAAFIWVRPLAPPAFFAGMIAMLVTGWIGLGRALR